MRRGSHLLFVLIVIFILISFVGCGDDNSDEATIFVPGRIGPPYTIMCWNVERFEATNSFSNIAAVVKTNEVDILILSECQSDGGNLTRMADALKSAGWIMPYHYFASRWNGLGVFSRYRVASTAEVVRANGPRIMYKVSVMLSNDLPVTLYGGHLKSGADTSSYSRRVAQSQALANYIRANHNLSRDYVLILGDMNTMGDGTGGNTDFEAGGTMEYLTLKDDADSSNDFLAVNYTYLPSTDTHKWPSLLDHIIISPWAASNYISGSVAVVPTPWTGSGIYSDHRPVKIQLGQ